MSAVIPVLNAGSSSIKFSLFPADRKRAQQTLICAGELDGIGHAVHFFAKDGTGKTLKDRRLAEGTSHEDALGALVPWLERQVAGTPHRSLIDASVVAELRHLVPLAPFDQPHHLAAIEALAKLHPTLPQVACFDTAFHHTQASVATTFALPRLLATEGIRRYGFHGISYEFIAEVLPDIVGGASEVRVVVAHLGSGASMCAMRGRKSVATT